MSNITLNAQISGYYYINASKNDKQVFVYFRLGDTESYILNFLFPKNKISYVFFYRNPDDNNNLWISTKAADNLNLAMEQPKFEEREKIQLVVVADPEKKSINFITEDGHDKLFSSNLFDKNDKVTSYENSLEVTVRSSIVEGNAGTKFTGWLVDNNAKFAFVDSEISQLVQLTTKLRSYLNNHSLGAAMRNMPSSLHAPFINTMAKQIQVYNDNTSIRVPNK